MGTAEAEAEGATIFIVADRAYTQPIFRPKLRRFRLERTEDVSGSSGTGTVAEGVEYGPGGKVALFWAPGAAGAQSVGLYDRIEDVVLIHGHDGRTAVVYHDLAELLADGMTG